MAEVSCRVTALIMIVFSFVHCKSKEIAAYMYEAFITFFGNSMRVPYFLYEYLKNVVMFSEKHQHKIKKRQQIFR